MTTSPDIGRLLSSERYSESAAGRGAHGWDIRVKLFLLVVVIVLNIGLAIPRLSGALLFAGLGILIYSSPSPPRTALFFLSPLVATTVVFAGYSLAFGHTVLFSLGSLQVYKEGIELGLGVVVRVYCDVTWLAVTFITTPFTRVLAALRWYRVPGIIVDTLAVMYRYSFLLYGEFSRMYTAAVFRGGMRNRLLILKTLGLIGSKIFIRAYDRSERIYTAMVYRGGEHLHEEGIHTAKISRYENGLKVINTQNVSFGYRTDNRVLSGINLSVSKGESVVLTGPNGSGKTTLLKICAGILLPDQGKVEMMGMTLNKKTRNLVYKYAGFLFQDSDDQLFCPTVEEDIAFGPVNMKLGKAEVGERVIHALETMKISHLARRPVHDISGGEKKRAALAGLIAMRTPILILDEPLSGLDPDATARFVDLLRELNTVHNYTLLVSTHNIDSILTFATRIITLNNGCIEKDEQPGKI